ncbi:MAG TPA: dihydrodipicolinate synthase family protein [Chloroflexota bacterium]
MTLMRGIFPILITPFDAQERVDLDSLRKLVDFNIDAGVHGLGIALGSEILKLTEPERDLVISTVVDQVRGRVPVVVNTGAQASFTARLYSHQAQDLGAAAVMCMPPSPLTATEARSYFKAISDEISLPIFVQDTLTTPVSAALIRQLAEESEHVRYAKIESPPQPAQVQAAVAATDGLVTIFGGAGGTYLIEELRRGSVGTMPWPSQPHAFVRIWDLWHAGQQREAIELHERDIAPLGRLSSAGLRAGHNVHKEVLRRQGVIASSVVRGPADPLDDTTRSELDEVCARLGIGSVVV